MALRSKLGCTCVKDPHAIRRAVNFRRSKLRHLLSDQDIISGGSFKGSSGVSGTCCSRANRGAASHLRRVLRITTQISRLEPIFGESQLSLSQITKRIRGDENKYRGESRYYSQRHRTCFFINRAAVSPENISACPQARPGYRRRSPNVRS